MRFFGAISIATLAASLGFMAPVLGEYFATGLVPRMPTWILSIGLLVLSMMFAIAGLILDSVARGRAEQKRMVYLAYGPARAAPELMPAAKGKARAARTASRVSRSSARSASRSTRSSSPPYWRPHR